MEQQYNNCTESQISKTQPLNIVLVNTHRFFNVKGGVEKVFSEMANALSKRGHNVTVVCCDKNEGEPGFAIDSSVTLINAYKEKAPLVLKLLSKNFVVNLSSLHWDSQKRKHRRVVVRSKTISRLMMHKIGSALLKRHIDVFISFQAETTYILKLLYGDKVPIISMFHGHIQSYPELKVFGPYVEQSTVIQVLRPEFISDISGILPHASRVEVIGNAVPQAQSFSNRSSKVIICVARISSEKRIHLLVQAFALLKDQYPDWSLQIWGGYQNPTYTNLVNSIIKEHHLESCVKLCGQTDRVDEKLKHASIFAFPSRTEGFPLSLTEAMAHGLPAVGCKKCPSVNSLIRDGVNGVLCEDTPEGLALGLSKLMSNETLRIQLGNQAKEDMKVFSPDVIWQQWEKLLLSVVNSDKNVRP